MDPALISDLDEALGGPEPDYETEPEVPDDGDVDAALDQANRWLYHHDRLAREAQEVQERAARERARIDAWAAGRVGVIERRQAWFGRALGQLHAAVLRRAPKRRTIQLPHGTLKARPQQPEWVYVDEAAFLAWARASRPELVTQPPPPAARPAKTEAKAVLTLPEGAQPGDVVVPIDPSTGVPVPGLTVEIRGDKYSIDPPKEGQP